MRKQKVQRRLLAESDELQEKAAKINAEEKEMTMLSAINNILELAEGSKLSAEFFEQADPYMKYVCKVQGITPMQTVMLSYFLEEGSNHPQVSISELAMFLNCRTIRVLEYQEELEELIKRGILYKSTNSRDDSVSYIVPKRMIESLYKNQPYQRVSYACEGIKLFHHVYDITHLRYKEYLSTELMRAEVERLFEENKDCHYVKYLHSLGLDKDDELVLTQMSRHLVLGGVDCIPLDHLAFLFDHPYTKNTFIRSMEDGSHSLLRKGLVEMAFDGGFKNREGFRLSNGIRADLLKEYNIKISEDDVQCDVIKCDKIVSKDLYFEESVQMQLKGMDELLNETKYQSICARLKEKGLRQGVACLFYGAPGTGKTETVMQLARKSGRDIMQVNISQVKSMWVGESEKNIKAIFDRYRSIAIRSAKKPILLFNEADAVIGKRKEGADGAVDKMENSIQNIILQEMESLEGIMIATTNLVQNLDKAFERRFLYKVKFENPTHEQRSHIWKTLLPVLKDEAAGRLARCYDFSGGQIENIARKCDIESILHGEDAIDEVLIEQYCQEELIEKCNNKRIGFV